MIAISKTKQGGLNRAFPLSTFSLMCCCLKVRPSFPFCACVHTKICQKGKFVQTKVFVDTLFLKIEVAWVLETKNESFRKRSFFWVLQCCMIFTLCWLTVFNAIKVHFRVISHSRMRRQRQVRKQTHSNSWMAQKRKQDHSGNWLIDRTKVESWNKLKKRKKSNTGLCQPRSQVLSLRRDG